MIDYSQDGQALIVRQLITADTPRVLVDIGAHDGVTNSNSRALLEEGWRGVLVEPLPVACARLRENCRTFDGTVVLEAACAERSGAAFLRLGVDGTAGQMSSLSVSSGIASNLGPDTIEVQTLSLGDIFSRGRIPDDFGVLLVDTEGLDLQILQGLVRTTPRPRIVVTEDFAETDWEKYELLAAAGYGFVGSWGSDSIWISRRHSAGIDSVRLPVTRLAADWLPAGSPSPGRVNFEFIRRQCVVGWAFGEVGGEPPGEVVVDLRRVGSPQRSLFRAFRAPRADVAEHFRSPALWMSGFRACIDAPPGDYELRVIQQAETSYSEAVIGVVSIA